MDALEDRHPSAAIRGIAPNGHDSETQSFRLAHLFDTIHNVSTSLVDAVPH